MKLSQPIRDYVAYLEGRLQQVDEHAQADREQQLALLHARSTDKTVDFAGRLEARLAWRELKSNSAGKAAEAKLRKHLEAGFVTAARQKKYSALDAHDWAALGIPQDVARRITKGGASSTRVSKAAAVTWVSAQTGSFTHADAITALGGGSEKTITRAVEQCRSNGMSISYTDRTFTVHT